MTASFLLLLPNKIIQLHLPFLVVDVKNMLILLIPRAFSFVTDFILEIELHIQYVTDMMNSFLWIKGNGDKRISETSKHAKLDSSENKPTRYLCMLR